MGATVYSQPYQGYVTNAALLVEVSGDLHQVHLPFEALMFLVRHAEVLSDGKLALSPPIKSITLGKPRA